MDPCPHLQDAAQLAFTDAVNNKLREVAAENLALRQQLAAAEDARLADATYAALLLRCEELQRQADAHKATADALQADSMRCAQPCTGALCCDLTPSCHCSCLLLSCRHSFLTCTKWPSCLRCVR